MLVCVSALPIMFLSPYYVQHAVFPPVIYLIGSFCISSLQQPRPAFKGTVTPTCDPGLCFRASDQLITRLGRPSRNPLTHRLMLYSCSRGTKAMRFPCEIRYRAGFSTMCQHRLPPPLAHALVPVCQDPLKLNTEPHFKLSPL